MSKPKRHAVAADSIFDGITVRHNCAVVIEGADIVGIATRRGLAEDMPVKELPDGVWLAPGFIDVQVNGGGNRLFNNEPTPEAIAAIAAAHRRFGTTSLLPTLITDTDDKMRQALAAVEAAMKASPGILGIHLEGPFLSKEKPGVHNCELIRPADTHHLAMLQSLKGGVTVVTCAPECVSSAFISELANAGVRVSLGHSMATYDETCAAIADGLTGFTHLFNAMRPLAAREPGPIAAALEAGGCWYGLIVDGEHVSVPMLKLALRGAGSPMLVTDAMPPVGGRKTSFKLYGEEITVEEGRCVTKDGKLAGAAADMATAVSNCIRFLDVTLTEALTYASLSPARFLGLGDRLGRIAPGFRADLVAFQPDEVHVTGTWLAGEYEQVKRS
jgi:N-acetylglucosamine-6-phosphate deacetylase